MFKKLVRVVLAFTVAFLPLQGQAFAVTFDAEGTVTSVATFSAALLKVSDNSSSTKIVFPTGTGPASGDSYVNTSWNNNQVGFQAITIGTNNRSTAAPVATPKYIGIAQGSVAVGVTDANLVVPLRWTVFDAVVSGGHVFNSDAGEFFFQDKLQGTTSAAQNVTLGAAACNDANKSNTCTTGEFTEFNGTAGFQANLWTTGAADNRCAANTGTARFEGIDWDGDCYDGAKPYSTGFGSVVFGLAGLQGELSAADGTAAPAAGRISTDGNVKIYVGIDYSGADAQAYKTNTVTVEVVTI